MHDVEPHADRADAHAAIAPDEIPTEPVQIRTPDPTLAGDLLARMKQGDREAVGVFIDRFGDRIRRRVRGKLNPAMRRVFDSQEILSTVARRLDELVLDRKINAVEDAQLWSLVVSIAKHAAIDKARLFQRLKDVEGPDRVFALGLLTDLETAGQRVADGAEIHLERILLAVPDAIDRQILELWLRGSTLVAIAESLGKRPGTVRRRWGELKNRILTRVEGQLGE